MNPYMPFLLGIPGAIAIAAVFPRRRIVRWSLVAGACLVYWAIIPQAVDWAYTHPVINTKDGGARAFSACFGWLFGFVTLVLPMYLFTCFVQWVVRKLRKQSPTKLSSVPLTQGGQRPLKVDVRQEHIWER